MKNRANKGLLPVITESTSRRGPCRCQHGVLAARFPHSFESDLTYMLAHNERYGGTQPITFPLTAEMDETKAETNYETGSWN
jgi:hypothetical protein